MQTPQLISGTPLSATSPAVLHFLWALTCQQAVQADLDAQLLEAQRAAQHEAPQDAKFALPES